MSKPVEEHNAREFPKFRRSLFWDVNPDDIDPEKNMRFVIARVMHRGKLEEWRAIEEFYGREQIVRLIPTIRWQDAKTEALFKLWYENP